MSLTGLQGRRIAVIGNSGSGKSTLARALAVRLGVPHVELDALNWQPGWRALSIEAPEEWRAAVAAAITGDGWVTDGNYSQGAMPVILPRVLRRSLLRALDGHELWPGTGNREDFRKWLDKEHPIRWTWDTYRSGNEARAARFASPALDHARKHRFKTPRATARWLAAIG